MYHYCCNAPSKCLCLFKLSLPGQRCYCKGRRLLWRYKGSSALSGWFTAGPKLDPQHAQKGQLLTCVGCLFQAVQLNPREKGVLLARTCLFSLWRDWKDMLLLSYHQMLRAMITALLSRWQPHPQNKEREMLALGSPLLIPRTALTHETYKSLDTYWFITSLLKRKEQQKKSPNTQDPFTTYFCKTRNQINPSWTKGSFEFLRIRLPNH